VSNKDFINPIITDKSRGIYGHVDFINDEGIGGWVIDVESSESRVVEIYVNDIKIGEVVANLPRPDVAFIIGREANCGFFVRWADLSIPNRISLEDNFEVAIIDKLSGREIIGKHAKGRKPKFLGRIEEGKEGKQEPKIEDERIKEEYRIIKESGLFDEKWYLEQYSDVKRDNWDPILHYILYGWKEGRNPSPEFDTNYYLFSNVDVALSGVNPLIHYILYGRYEGRRPKENVSDTDYKLCYLHNLKTAQKKPSLEFVPESDVDLSELRNKLPFKLIAFYLPQFHPIPENNLWWGKGFTEWSNVTKAVSNFVGHYQPHLPIDLGFYDLRVPEVRKRQVELAKKYGIYGFCFYVYWFSGKRLLERPLDEFIEDKEIDFPFCISWANENWTRRWDGLDKEVLMPQIHTYESDCRFIHDMVKYISHKNYIRINGKPVILVQRAHDLEDPIRTAEYWKTFCIKEGLGEPILVAVHSFGFYNDPKKLGFDVALEFPPLFPENSLKRIEHFAKILNPDFRGSIHDYKEAVDISINKKRPSYKYIRTALVSWDNTARRQDFPSVFIYSSPYLYKKWLSTLIKYAINSPYDEEKLVFINAWNEWAESNHLEPDRTFGYGFLQATAEAVLENTPQDIKVKEPNIVLFRKDDRIFYEEINSNKINRTSNIAVIIHLYYTDLWEEFKEYLKNIKHNYDLLVSIPVEVFVDTKEILKFHDNAYIYRNINRGRDIAPFLSIFKAIYPLRYKFGLKFHSKKSPHRKDGDLWRISVLNKIAGSSEIVDVILNTFYENNDIGVIIPKNIAVSYKAHEGSNRKHLKNLCEMLGINWQGEDFLFPAGTFFWFRFKALEDLMRLNLSLEDFEPEFHQLDGCLHHAIERLIGLIIKTREYLYGLIGKNGTIEIVKG
jgi:lipopolysaccharide biosynthesis protein